LLFCGLAVAKEWWEKKNYDKWSKKEVARMLDDSPWGQIHTVTIVNPASPGGSRSFENLGRGDLEREKQNRFHLRFLSAKPVRMAFVRNIMMNAAGNVNKEMLEKYVEQSNEEYIIIAMQVSTVPAGSSTLQGYLAALNHLRVPDLVNTTALSTDSGRRVYITHYEPPGRDGLGAKFIFKRRLPDGSSLVSGDDKEIRFETTIELTEDLTNTGLTPNDPQRSIDHKRSDRIFMKFDLRKMIFDGKLEI
jgi:hypothetical protein